MTNTNALPTKTQIDNLIATCLSAGYNEAAGLITLASESISENVKRDTEETCVCLEVIGDNGTCPVHGPGFEQAKADEPTEADYESWNDEQNRLHYEMLDARDWENQVSELRGGF